MLNSSLEPLFMRLSRSRFRSGFRLNSKDLSYLKAKGLQLIEQHAKDFIKQRLAPAVPVNDGRQTPWKGHPVFVAQHAAATCCRGCLLKWHGIELDKALTLAQQNYIVSVIMYWLVQLDH